MFIFSCIVEEDNGGFCVIGDDFHPYILNFTPKIGVFVPKRELRDLILVCVVKMQYFCGKF